MYFFLLEDFNKLNAKITEICDKVKEIGQEMGESCREGAETFHDNFAYEDGERNQAMLSNRLRYFISIRNNARITRDEHQTKVVALGNTVTFSDESGEKHTHKIGSYLTFSEDDSEISYNSPLARLIKGAKVGEIREGKIGHSKRSFTILDIK